MMDFILEFSLAAGRQTPLTVLHHEKIRLARQRVENLKVALCHHMQSATVSSRLRAESTRQSLVQARAEVAELEGKTADVLKSCQTDHFDIGNGREIRVFYLSDRQVVAEWHNRAYQQMRVRFVPASEARSFYQKTYEHFMQNRGKSSVSAA